MLHQSNPQFCMFLNYAVDKIPVAGAVRNVGDASFTGVFQGAG